MRQGKAKTSIRMLQARTGRKALLSGAAALYAVVTVASGTTARRPVAEHFRGGAGVPSVGTPDLRESARTLAEPEGTTLYGGVREAAEAIMDSPRPYEGPLAGLPVATGVPLPPPAGKSARDWLDFGPLGIGLSSAPGEAILSDSQRRIFGIATVGDFSESDTCGAAGWPARCTVSVTFRPRHEGLARGELVILAGDTLGDSGKIDVVLYETRLFGYGSGSAAPEYVGSIRASSANEDSIGLPPDVSAAHCFAQPTDAEAPTLTGVYAEVAPGPPPLVILHHSSAKTATFDVFCSSTETSPPAAAPPPALVVPIWSADGGSAIIP